MGDTANLWVYFLLVFGVIALPGMDMAYVMGSAMTSGRRAGLAAVAGIVVGGVCHMVMSTTGISLVLQLLPGAFTLMLIAGVAYMIWIGWSLIRSASVAVEVSVQHARTPVASFKRAVLTSLLNPKAYLFMLAVFPQFIRAQAGSIWAQASVLSAITAATQTSVYGGLALLAAQVPSWLAAHPHANRIVARLVGGLLIVVALWALWRGMPVVHLPPVYVSVAFTLNLFNS